MGLVWSCVRRLLCAAGLPAPAPVAGAADDDTAFDPALLAQDGEALRSQAHTLGDAASAASAASRAAYAAGDGAGAKALSLQAGAHREAAARAHAAAARAIFAQKNHARGQWELDLHQLLVAEATERVQRRLASCTAAAAAEAAGGRELSIIYGQGHHSAGGVAKIKPAVLSLLREGGWLAREGVPNPGAAPAPARGRALRKTRTLPGAVRRAVRHAQRHAVWLTRACARACAVCGVRRQAAYRCTCLARRARACSARCGAAALRCAPLLHTAEPRAAVAPPSRSAAPAARSSMHSNLLRASRRCCALLPRTHDASTADLRAVDCGDACSAAALRAQARCHALWCAWLLTRHATCLPHATLALLLHARSATRTGRAYVTVACSLI
jgi:hypothetical protein